MGSEAQEGEGPLRRAFAVELAHTAELAPEVLSAARAQLDAAFAGEFTDADWDHALGGMHALAFEDGALAGHGAVVQRRLLCGGRTLRCGYVEAVGVRADRRRRGLGAALMQALGDVIRGAYDLGALSATEAGRGLYEESGWQRWQGPLDALTPDGLVETPGEAGAVYVLPVATELDLTAELVCDWRDGDLW